MPDHELELGSLQADDGSTVQHWHEALADAIDLASDQDQVTWLVSDSKRIAAIVPVDQVRRIRRTS